MTTTNGGLFAYTHHDHKIVAVVGVACQTDFAERTDEFMGFSESLAKHVAWSEAETLEDLLAEEFLLGEGESISQVIDKVKAKLGEEIKILSFTKLVF